ncbi:MAG: hypothetical protein NC098_09090 [Lachnoclostridium sp.]|nr:hypothetical protein [Lachnoclostridium sp.]
MDTINNFSINRVGLVTRYFGAAIRIQLLIYFLITALVYVMSAVSIHFFDSMLPLWAFGSIAINYMVYLGALVYFRYEDSMITTLIPARGCEKALVIVGYVAVFIPLFVIAVWGLCSAIGSVMPFETPAFKDLFGISIVSDSEELPFRLSDIMKWYSVPLQWDTIASITLFVVISSSRNRIVKGLLTAIGVNIASSILGLIAGIILAVTKIYAIKESAGSFENINPDSSEFLGYISDILMSYFQIVTIVSIAIAVLFYYLSWRKVVNRQV